MNDESGKALLSEEETEALLEAMRRADGGLEGGELRPADLTASERHLQEESEACRKVLPLLAEELRALTFRLVECSVSLESATLETPQVSSRGPNVQGVSRVAIRSVKDGRRVGWLVLPYGLLRFILDRRFGAPLNVQRNDAAEVDVRVLSAVEKRVLQPLLRDLVGSAASHLVGERSLWSSGELGDESEQGEEFAPKAHLDLQISLRPLATGAEVLRLVLDPEVMRTFRPLRPAPRPAARGPLYRKQMAALLQEARVELVAILGRTESSIARVLALEVGDVIRLEQSRDLPTELWLEDRVVALGRPVTREGIVSLEVSEIRDASREFFGMSDGSVQERS